MSGHINHEVASSVTLVYCRMYKQRVILGAVAVFFVFLILVILYFKLVRRA